MSVVVSGLFAGMGRLRNVLTMIPVALVIVFPISMTWAGGMLASAVETPELSVYSR